MNDRLHIPTMHFKAMHFKDDRITCKNLYSKDTEKDAEADDT
ncbi:MAG TPA: hypothetical protein V6C65_40385 [Allocoleopsis sp.]